MADVEKDIAEINNRLNDLREKAKALRGDAKGKLDEKIARLAGDVRDAEVKLLAVKNAASDKWKDLKVSLSAALEKMEETAKSAGGGTS